MKRRDFLRGLSGASLAMLSSGIACTNRSTPAARDTVANAKSTTWYLNVFVHGMFAIVVDLKGSRYKDKPKIRLLAPRVSSHYKHRYMAKMFQAVGANDLKETWSHEVIGASTVPGNISFPTPNSSNFDPHDDPNRIVIMVDQTSDVAGKPAWIVDLPAIPTDICQLRAAHSNYLNPGLTYMHSRLNLGQWSPLVNVIRYEFSSQSEPSVSFSPEPNTTQKVNFDNGVARLHLFAEPDTKTMCHDGHLQDAINEFSNLFHEKLDISLMSTADCLYLNSDPIPDSCNAGILLCEERSLEEVLNETCSKFASGKTVQQQYADDEGTKKVQAAWMEFLEEDAKVSLAKQSDPIVLNTESKKFIESHRKLLSLNSKPPSNCMSLVCLNP